MTPSTILLIRHADKASEDGSIQGVAVDGSADPDSLSVRGWQRAGALIRFFLDRTSQGPMTLFAAAPTSLEPSKRALQTLSPLADVLGQPIQQGYAIGDESQLAATILQTDGIVLVAWEHKAIHRIANAVLGSDNDVPQSWPAERFDILWTLAQSGAGWSFKASGQHLLAGDRDV